MAEPTKQPDRPEPALEDLLIDLRLGQAAPEQAERIKEQLAADADLRARDEDLRRALGALDRLPAGEPSETLLADTMARIDSARRTDALLAREEATRSPRRATFSGREAIAAAAAILILAAVFLPTMHQARVRSAQIQCRANVAQIGAAARMYADENGDALPVASYRAEPWLPDAGPSPVSNSAALFKLIKLDHAPQQVFRCPAVGGKPFVVEAGMRDFPEPGAISYSYQHAVGPGSIASVDGLRELPTDMAILADENPLFPHGRFDPSRLGLPASDNHDHRGQNVLYPDGRVQWVETANAGHAGDNIFRAGDHQTYTGTEAPAGPYDSFLLPSSGPRAGRRR